MLKKVTARWRAFFNVRFEAAAALARTHAAELDGRIDHLSASVADIEAASTDTANAVASMQAAMLGVNTVFGRSLNEISTAIHDQGDTLTAAMGVRDGVAQISRGMQELLRKSGADRFDTVNQGDIATLDSYHAAVANWAQSHTGWAAQAGLWFNPPVSVLHAVGGVREAVVNERIAEVPFVYRALADVPRSARVLDVGCRESTVALSLATLGYEVTGVDLRPYPLSHPNLTVHVGEIAGISGDEIYDVVISLSTVEHIGVGSYDGAVDSDGDLRAMERIRQLCRIGGRLVFSAPYGAFRITELERIYDASRLDLLLKGWRVDRCEYLSRLDDLTWTLSDEPGPVDRPGVVLLTATREE